ncbi:uncharacterized protein LOC126686860 [Mercurialis annua]|uniref:uncharacterized protein LOC126686860 n=1 Tax=Mercurialis annua TaxID=3986 RepID=UPI00215F8F62|nr:uncharacterized protein LOC126686860 [Mercurialis annua]
MALSLPSTILIISFSVFVLAGDAVRDMPEKVPMNIILSNDTRLKDYVHVATLSHYWTHWHGVCFEDNMGYWGEAAHEHSWVWIILETHNPYNWKCSDHYQFAVDHQVIRSDFFFRSGSHSELIHVSDELRHRMHEHGINVYLYKSSETKDNKSRHDLSISVVAGDNTSHTANGTASLFVSFL